LYVRHLPHTATGDNTTELIAEEPYTTELIAGEPYTTELIAGEPYTISAFSIIEYSK